MPLHELAHALTLPHRQPGTSPAGAPAPSLRLLNGYTNAVMVAGALLVGRYAHQSLQFDPASLTG
jgi:hypothetical protein